MGLDMGIRVIRKGAILQMDENCNEFYDEDDEIELMWGQGRSEFHWLREWVGDDRYGQYITITPDVAATLIDIITEQATDLPSIERGSGRCLALLALAPIYDKMGWEMQIECDW